MKNTVQRAAVDSEIAGMGGNRLLNTNVDDLVGYIVEKFRIDVGATLVVYTDMRCSSNRCGICDGCWWVRELGLIAQNFALPQVMQAEPDLVRFPKRHCFNYVVVRLREGIGQRQRVCRGLRRACGGVRPGHEGGVANERHSPEGHSRHREIDNSLHERLAVAATSCRKAGGRSESAADRGAISTSSATRPGGTDDPCRWPVRSLSTRGSSAVSSTLRYQTQL
jgi:hypothetical protein